MLRLTLTIAFASTMQILGTAQRIDAGGYHNLYTCDDSTMQSWGNNSLGELGSGITGISNVPINVVNLSDIAAVSAGLNFSVALRNDGTVWTWGMNITGQLGNGSSIDYSDIPVQVTSLFGITAISCGAEHALALRDDGTVWAWGYNIYGLLGNGTLDGFSNVPIQVSTINDIVAIASGNYHSLALESNGNLWAWGYNGGGPLGYDTPSGYSTAPQQVTTLSAVTGIACGNGFSLVLKNDGTLWSFGANNEGELGNGVSAVNSQNPVQVLNLTNVVSMTAGTYHSLAVKSDGTVWAWGFNLYGQLGSGTNSDSNVPLQVAGLSGVTAISAGYAHSVVVQDDASVWSFGYNNYGQLGVGDFENRNVPIQISGLCEAVIAVSEKVAESHIHIFPNPSNGKFQLNIDHVFSRGKYLLEIFNIEGKCIRSEIVSNAVVDFEMKNLISGIYMLRLSQNGMVLTERLVIE